MSQEERLFKILLIMRKFWLLFPLNSVASVNRHLLLLFHRWKRETYWDNDYCFTRWSMFNCSRSWRAIFIISHFKHHNNDSLKSVSPCIYAAVIIDVIFIHKKETFAFSCLLHFLSCSFCVCMSLPCDYFRFHLSCCFVVSFFLYTVL